MSFFMSLSQSGGGSTPPSDLSKDYNVSFDGDSLTWEQSGAHSFANYIKTQMIGAGVSSFTLWPFGVSGQTLQTMLVNQAATYAKIDALKENVIVAYNSVNSILNAGTSAQTQYDDMVTYITNAKNNGYKKAIVITGYHPRLVSGEYNNPTWNSRIDNQEAYFDLIKNTISPIWDAHVDLRLESTLGGAKGQDYNPAYFKDSVHLFQNGDELVGDFVYENGFKAIYSI